MTIFSFPQITPNSSSFELVTNTKTFRSPITNAVQTQNRQGSLWKVGMSFNNLSGNDRSEMQAFLARLNGQEHRFALYDHSYTRRGAGTGTLSINGANQSGASLVCVTTGFSITNYFKAGDYISFNNELHMVTVDASSDGAGAITLSIAPPIRKPTINAQSVDYTGTVNGVFMLASKSGWTNELAGLSSFSLDAVEDVLA